MKSLIKIALLTLIANTEFYKKKKKNGFALFYDNINEKQCTFPVLSLIISTLKLPGGFSSLLHETR